MLEIKLLLFHGTQVDPEGTSALAAGSRVLFLETVRRSNAACQNGDYALAATLYTEALALDPLSHVLYSNRSAARLKMGLFAAALQDAVRATELSPQWPKVYAYPFSLLLLYITNSFYTLHICNNHFVIRRTIGKE